MNCVKNPRKPARSFPRMNGEGRKKISVRESKNFDVSDRIILGNQRK